MMKMKERPMQQVKKFPHVYVQEGRFKEWYVQGSAKPFFDEFVKKDRGVAYRRVEPERSKLFAAIAKDISQIGIKEDSKVLYLGASHGYTVSFLSDMVKQGCVFALDFAPRVMRDLVVISEQKSNVAPIFADANNIDDFSQIGKVDVVFMDIAQRDQVRIFLKNCDHFLNSGGFGLLALKARSVDVTKKPKDIFKQVRSELEQHVTIVDYRELAPFEKDHAFFVVKKR